MLGCNTQRRRSVEEFGTDSLSNASSPPICVKKVYLQKRKANYWQIGFVFPLELFPNKSYSLRRLKANCFPSVSMESHCPWNIHFHSIVPNTSYAKLIILLKICPHLIILLGTIFWGGSFDSVLNDNYP